MTEYTVPFSATTNSATNTEDTVVEISVNNPRITRIQIHMGDGTEPSGLDNSWRVRLVRKTAGGATGTGGTIVRTDQIDETSGATVTVKNGTSAFTTATLGDILHNQVLNWREPFSWIAMKASEQKRVHPTLGSGGMFAVLIQSAVASQKYMGTITFED